MQVQPYLFFDGRAEEAIDFYKKTIGAEVTMLMRWKDSPDKSMCTPANENKVMHASLKIGETRVMASDGRNTGHPDFKVNLLSGGIRDLTSRSSLLRRTFQTSRAPHAPPLPTNRG